MDDNCCSNMKDVQDALFDTESVDPYVLSEMPVFCTICQLFREGPCVRHGIRNKDYPCLPMAKASLPASLILQPIPSSSDPHFGRAVEGVFAREKIAALTIFGPLIAPLADEIEQENPGSPFGIRTDSGWKEFSLKSEHLCNWMKNVRLASYKNHQNLLAYQQDGCIYFSALCDIQPETELRVWYSQRYGRRRGKRGLGTQPSSDENASICGDSSYEQHELISNETVLGESNQLASFPSLEGKTDFLGSNLSEGIAAGNASLPLTLVFADSKNLLSNVQQKKRGKNSSAGQPSKRRPKKRKLDKVENSEEPGTEVSASVNNKTLPRSSKKRKKGPNTLDHYCNQCQLTFLTKEILEIHSVSHEGIMPTEFSASLTCPIEVCRLTVSSQQELVAHVHLHQVKGHVRRIPTDFHCNSCDKYYSSAPKLQRHIHRVHSKRSISAKHPKQLSGLNSGDDQTSADKTNKRCLVFGHSCDSCGVKFRTQVLLEIHSVSHGGIMPAEFSTNLTCPVSVCRLVVNSPEDLVAHVDHHRCSQDLTKVASDFPCSLCGKYFSCARSLRMHTGKAHSGRNKASYQFQCDVCKKTFVCKTSLQVHQQVRHMGNSTTLFECPICQEKFATTHLLHCHTAVHCVDGRYACTMCEKNFDACFKLRRHMTNRHTGPDLKCESCGYTTKNSDVFFQHMIHHSKDYLFKCENCSMKFRLSGEYTHHKKRCVVQFAINSASGVEQVTYMGNQSVRCKHCEASFRTQSLLDIHSVAHGGIMPTEVASSLTCPVDVCRTVVNSPQALVAHIDQHRIWKNLREIVTDFQCSFCQNYYPTARKLEVHVRFLHSGRNAPDRFPCDVCKKTFQSEERVQIHKTLKHGKNSLRARGDCPICLLTFASNRLLRAHSAVHCDLSTGRYPCRMCEMDFDNCTKLRRHMDVRHLFPDLKCDVCDYTTKNPDCFLQHKLTHSTKYKFECRNCSLKFKMMGQYNKHKKQCPDPIDASNVGSPDLKVVSREPPKEYSTYPFKCDECKIGFLRRKTLVGHMSANHPDRSKLSIPELNVSSVTLYKYSCPVCSLTFGDENSRLRHCGSDHQDLDLSLEQMPAKKQSQHIYLCGFCQYKNNSVRNVIKHIEEEHPTN